jgi:hypothetical protein
MKHLACFSLFAAAVSTFAQTPDPRYGIKEDQPRIGSHLRSYAVKPFTIPINLTYEQLSPSDRIKVHNNYEAIAPGDEPPFPAGGLVAILDPLRKAQQKLLVTEELSLVAVIDSTGKAIEVSAYGSQDSAMAKTAAHLLLLTPFKPAVCSGQPCQMQFPLRMNFRVE